MENLLFVCTTCDRNAPNNAQGGSAGESLARGFAQALGELPVDDAIEVRQVACLNGCLRACNVAVRGSGRFTYRFSRIVAADIPAVIAFASAYWRIPNGCLDLERLPAGLRAKLTVCTPPAGG